jgi:hypothetical protein
MQTEGGEIMYTATNPRLAAKENLVTATLTNALI